jgi:hypothetical protein
MTTATEADKRAVLRLIGCQYPGGCDWVGSVTVQMTNMQGPKWRSCRSHSRPFYVDDNYRVVGSTAPNRRLTYDFPELSGLTDQTWNGVE